jgi:hypothetical protein
MTKQQECDDAIAKCQAEQLRASNSSGVPKAQLDAKIAALTTERNR